MVAYEYEVSGKRFRGDRMFIVDFGVLEPGLDLMQPGTGKVWVVTPGRPRRR